MSAENQIRDTIQLYFDGMYESSAEKTHRAFHPNAKITGYLEDGLHQKLKRSGALLLTTMALLSLGKDSMNAQTQWLDQIPPMKTC